MTRTGLVHFLAALVVALMVVAFLAYVSGAPTWAAVGFGIVVYLNEIKHPAERR